MLCFSIDHESYDTRYNSTHDLENEPLMHNLNPSSTTMIYVCMTHFQTVIRKHQSILPETKLILTFEDNKKQSSLKFVN